MKDKKQTIAEEEATKKKEEAELKHSQHQAMLSAILKKGYQNLTEEERRYWNSVY